MPIRPRANGKVERANGVLKAIVIRDYLLFGTQPYTPFYLLFGTQPADRIAETQLVQYEREETDEEERQWAKELVQHHAAPIARTYVASVKASQDATRAMLQEKKGLIRVYGKGDWVLRVRQRAHKQEPYYDGPWEVCGTHHNNTYSLRSPGGMVMRSKYNGTNLFPAYVQDGHPVKSLWYGSRLQLRQDRRRYLEAVGLEARDKA